MDKIYNETRMARGFHLVSFHDGVKTHHDGSPFFDVRLFKRERDAAKFARDLKKSGYTYDSALSGRVTESV